MKKVRKLINRIKYYNCYFERKTSLIIFLLIVLSVVVPVFSGTPTNNFWYRLYMIKTDLFHNMILFIAIGINTIYYSKELTNSTNVISRYDNYKGLIKYFITDIIYITIYVYIISLVLSVAGSVLLCFNDFSIMNYLYYDISLPLYIFFFLIRGCIIHIIINIIVYLILVLINKYFSYAIILMFAMLFLILPFHEIITHFYNMPILFHYYFSTTVFNSFLLEFICTIIEIFILIIVLHLMINITTCKKRDIV